MYDPVCAPGCDPVWDPMCAPGCDPVCATEAELKELVEEKEEREYCLGAAIGQSGATRESGAASGEGGAGGALKSPGAAGGASKCKSGRMMPNERAIESTR